MFLQRPSFHLSLGLAEVIQEENVPEEEIVDGLGLLSKNQYIYRVIHFKRWEL